ncbi:MAG: AMIN domain-containing protein [Bdellovibrionales bacterium]|nr:AMIN domain-containing protein [Bdellovibrionales bacterium]
MLKIILFLFLLFSYRLEADSYLKLVQDESVFDESDLVDIESGFQSEDENDDALLEKEFNKIENDESENNFDPENFEEITDEYEEEIKEYEDGGKKNLSEKEEDFNYEDYEVLSDRPGYEVLTDEELEKEFDNDGNLDVENFEGEEILEEELEGEDLDEKEEVLEEEDLGLEDLSEEETLDEDIDKEEILEEGDLGDLSEEESLDEDIDKEEILDEGDLGDLPEEEGDLGLGELPEEETLDEELENEEVLEEGDLGDLPEEETLDEDMDKEETLEEEGDLDLGELPLDEELENEEVLEGGDLGDLPEEELLEDTLTQESNLNLVTNIRYLVESDQIVISTSEIPSYKERLNQETNQLIIEILQSRLAKNLKWPYILRDFDTDFGLIQADQKDSSTVRVIIQMKKEALVPPVNFTEDEGIVIGEARFKGQKRFDETLQSDLLPSKSLKDLYFGNIDFVGEPISFHVIDADIRQVLNFISEESGLNMIIDEEVQGTITLKLEDIPWDQALFTIFKVKSLGYTRDGNIITVLTLKKIEEQTIRLKEISDKQKNLAPIQTKVLLIKYVKASDIEADLNKFSTPAVQGLSEGGKIIVHKESNSLVIMDNMETIEKMEKLVKVLDRPSKQVMVESKIVEISKNFARNFGLNWNLSGDLPVRIASNGLLNFLQTTFDGLSSSWSIQDKGRTNSFSLSGLPFIGDITATLNLAESQGVARVLNSSKILVKSGQAASIDKNTPILIREGETETASAETAGTTTVTTTFNQQDVKFNSTVTPTVTSSGSIAINVNLTLSNPGPGGEGGATVITRTSQTEIITGNGQTVVFSGISQKTEIRGKSGIPFLKDIPILNLFFRDGYFSTSGSEMLMFVTPTLIEN